MLNGRFHICGFLRHLHVQNEGGRSKIFETYIYKRYVDDAHANRKLNEAETLFDALNPYHPRKNLH